MNKEELILEAKKVSENSYSPYSNYMVGAALLTNDNKIYTGCNIENNGIQSICAERVAFSKALSEGQKEFKAIAVVGKRREEVKYKETLPCGYCRQFIQEFVKEDFKIYVCDDNKNEIKEFTIKELLPYSFDMK